MGIPDHLTCLLRNLYVGQEATVGTGCGTIDWFQRCILSPCLFNLYASTFIHKYIMWNAMLDEVQARMKIAGRKIKRVAEKYLLLLYWLCQSFWLYGSQQTVENSSRDGNTRSLYMQKKNLRNLNVGQEATVRTGHGTTDWFQIGKGVHQGCILSPCLFNLYAEYIMWNAGLDEA